MGVSRDDTLNPLLDHLAAQPPVAPQEWRGWRIAPVGGGANNRLFRATSGEDDFAVKFTLRDERDRAGREYRSVAALDVAGLDIAPRPVLLDRDRYLLPVVVTTWLAGRCRAEPPQDDDGWAGLIDHFITLHEAMPVTETHRLPPVVLTMRSVEEGLAAIGAQIDRLPVAARPDALVALARKIERGSFPHWPAPRLSLCRGDPNSSNFIERPGTWASVDWEYAGWGDAAFEIADLITHPAYATVPHERWEWVVARYCAGSTDRRVGRRIRAYIPLMLVWWMARFARRLYEVPRGLDARLVAPAPGWADRTQSQYERYRDCAAEVLARRA